MATQFDEGRQLSEDPDPISFLFRRDKERDMARVDIGVPPGADKSSSPAAGTSWH